MDRRFIFGETEKEQFVRLMREYEAPEAFCQVRVLTFCISIMSNHYHILLEVAKRPEVLPTAEQLLELLEGLVFEEDYSQTKAQIELFRAAKDGDGEKALLPPPLTRALTRPGTALRLPFVIPISDPRQP